MCGIVAIVTRPSSRPVPAGAGLLGQLDAALTVKADIVAAASGVSNVDHLLRGVSGVRALIAQPELVLAIEARLDQFDAVIEEEDRRLENVIGAELERSNANLIGLRDAVWAVRHDRIRTAAAVAALAGRDADVAALSAYLAIQLTLSAIDRLEVRGRDSAGIHLFVWDHQLDLGDPAIRAMIDQRSHDLLYTSRSVRVVDNVLSFVYKAAAEIGELGDNTAAMRAAIESDDLLRSALRSERARLSVLSHTRWASVGIISEANAHPVNQEEDVITSAGPYVVGALNGDVDNHADLKAAHGLRFAAPITTDAKVIPALTSRLALAAGGDLVEGFRRAVSSFDGSVAIGAAGASQPNRIMLAQRGSGQALYVGLGEDCFVVASEPYGLVEVTDRYVRLDGESPAHADQPSSRGQILVIDGDQAGDLAGLRRLAYDGTDLALSPGDIAVAEVTTRDIDRGAAPHFLFKELLEAPGSLYKTLRGRLVEVDGLVRSVVGDRALPASIAERLRSGTFRRVTVIGQGTAAVAGQSMAAVLSELAGDTFEIEAITATELSGFGLRVDMSDTLIVAVSQSGTTTDTNRTVDLARGRGAAVIGIVNRRGSDLSDKADGVLYTSDGRDVEMSVASTKAFYAQVAAGALLACSITAVAGVSTDARRDVLLRSLRSLPDALRAVLALRPTIGDAARAFAPQRRYWAVVGSGSNKVAAEEVRIKLSELCYKSISCDITEDKKHIDLSCEPLILVCAAGLVGGTADDVAKEVAIFRAHKAAPIVIATEGEERFNAALCVIKVPAVDRSIAFVLSAMVGHLFGYEAALAIDASARPLREARQAIELGVEGASSGEVVLRGLRTSIAGPAQQFFDGLRIGLYDGHLEASAAVRVVSLLHDVISDTPLESFQRDSGKVGTPSALIDDVTAALTRAIEQLTRPIDAIKHQAKTVTVGISRSDEGVLGSPLVQELLKAGAGRDRVAYRTLKILADLDPAVASVVGFTRYRIEGDPASRNATISVIDRGGISTAIRSRVDHGGRLIGTKRRVASERELLVARGRADGRMFIMIPEVKGSTTTGITLLHIAVHRRLPPAVLRGVLQGYDRRYDRLVDWVTETEGTFRDDLLSDVDVDDLLVAPISEIANRWRST
jgi:glutamine---fructose-6-phosphate transaminase (isomerizing)